MNIRKPTDYSAMYAVLDQLMETALPTGRAILRDGTSYLCQIGKGGSSGCFRVSAGHIPGRHGFLPPVTCAG